jgi:peptidoglycan/LPS O-acetylase OafA/YrhL
MFFVISGFVVAGSLLRKQSASARDMLLDFYSRRVKRLVPAMWCSVFATSVLLATAFPPVYDRLDEYYTAAQWALLGMANVNFALRGQGYTDDGPETLESNPFTHMWSLGVEEQFYFTFPMILVMAYGTRVVAGSGNRCSHYCSQRPSRLLVCTAALSFVTCFVATYVNQQWAFYMTPSRFWQLMSGAILYHWQDDQARRQLGDRTATTTVTMSGEGQQSHPDQGRGALAWLAVITGEMTVLGLMAVAFTLTPGDHDFPLPWSIFAIGAALGLIALGCPSLVKPQVIPGSSGRITSPLIPTFIGCAPVAYVGRLSYPLYLAHWPVFVGFKWLGDFDAMTDRCAAIAITVVAALVIYHGVEGCARRWRPRRQWLIFALGFGMIGLLEIALQALKYANMHISTVADVTMLTPPFPPLPGHLSQMTDVSPLSPPQSRPPPPSPCPPRIPTIANVTMLTPPLPPLPGHLSQMTHMSPLSPPQPLPSPPSPSCPPRVTRAAPQLPPPPQSPPAARCMCRNSGPFPGHPRSVSTLHSPPQVDTAAPVPCLDEAATSRHTSHWWQHDPCWQRPNSQSGPAHFEMQLVVRCLTPNRGPENKRALWLFGDSHAAAISIGLRAAVEAVGMVFVWTAAGICPLGPREVWNRCMDIHVGDKVRQYQETVLMMLQQGLRAGDVVALVRWEIDLHAPGSSVSESSFVAFYQASLLPQIQARGAKLLLLHDSFGMKYGFDPGPCARHLHSSECEYAYNSWSTEPHRTYNLGVKNALAARYPNTVFVYELGPLLCDGRVCNSQVPGTSLRAYDDYHHLSSAAALYHAPYLCAAMDAW